MYIRDWFIRWLYEYGDRKKYKGLPRGCWNCEVLGLCRRPKEEGWKCYDGCMLINAELAYKYEGLLSHCLWCLWCALAKSNRKKQKKR